MPFDLPNAALKAPLHAINPCQSCLSIDKLAILTKKATTCIQFVSQYKLEQLLGQFDIAMSD